MEAPRLLTERPLEHLLRQAVEARSEGLVVVRDRDGLRHGVWLQGGYAVGAHVAGRFDPLLELLRRRGALSDRGHRACVGVLGELPVRSGVIATELCGVPPESVRDAVRAQLVARLAALLTLSRTVGYDAHLERRAVPLAERCLRMPVGALFRRIDEPLEAWPSEPAMGREAARRRLRAIAKRLHPDRHGDLDPHARQLLADLLAQATAAYHGFS